MIAEKEYVAVTEMAEEKVLVLVTAAAFITNPARYVLHKTQDRQDRWDGYSYAAQTYRTISPLSVCGEGAGGDFIHFPASYPKGIFWMVIRRNTP